MPTIRNFEHADQEVVRWLIIEGLGEHWGSIDLSLNQDLNDMQASFGHGRILVAEDLSGNRRFVLDANRIPRQAELQPVGSAASRQPARSLSSIVCAIQQQLQSVSLNAFDTSIMATT